MPKHKPVDAQSIDNQDKGITRDEFELRCLQMWRNMCQAVSNSPVFYPRKKE